MRGVHHRLVVRAAGADVVAVEGDVHVAERDRLAHQLGDQVAQADGQEGAAGVDADDRDPLAAGLLDDLVRDADQDPPHVFAVEHFFLAQVNVLPGLSGPG